MKILLASASPRRKDILERLIGQKFTAKAVDVDENPIDIENLNDFSLSIVRRKLNAVDDLNLYDLVIAGDTLVALNDKVYGKPIDEKNALDMLVELRGKTHKVISSVAVYYKGLTTVRVIESEVKFKDLDDAELKKYLNKYYVLDKAGAYGIQDNVLVESYTGSYTNILGLPEEALIDILHELKLSYLLKY